MDFFDVEGVLVEFVLEDQLLQIVERLFMSGLFKKKKGRKTKLLTSLTYR